MRQATPEYVAARFEEAVATLRKLPATSAPGWSTWWPEMVYTPRELARQTPQSVRVRATPDEITRMEETLRWVVWISQGDRRLLWCRACRRSWRAIALETGLPKDTAKRHWQRALVRVSGQLNQTKYNPSLLIKQKKCKKSGGF